ncbi:hypothetical protein FKM82_017408 [Ascaphus truei]
MPSWYCQMCIFLLGCRVRVKDSSTSVAWVQFSFSVLTLHPPNSVVTENWVLAMVAAKAPVSADTVADTFQLFSMLDIFSFSYPTFLVIFFVQVTGVSESLEMVFMHSQTP